MELKISATPKEIADLVKEVQSQPECADITQWLNAWESELTPSKASELRKRVRALMMHVDNECCDIAGQLRDMQ